MGQDSKGGRGASRDDVGLPCGLREPRYPGQKNQKENLPVPQKPMQNISQRSQSLSSVQCPLNEDTERADKSAHVKDAPADSDTSDDAPEDLNRENTDRDHECAKNNKALTTKPLQSSFWEFKCTHNPDYRGDVGPILRKPRGDKTLVKCNQPSTSSIKINDEGTLIHEGFEKQKPAKSDAILRVRCHSLHCIFSEARLLLTDGTKINRRLIGIKSKTQKSWTKRI